MKNNKILVLNAIKEHFNKHVYSPTHRELCELTGIKSTHSTHNYLNALKSDGYITFEKYKQRTISLTQKGYCEGGIND